MSATLASTARRRRSLSGLAGLTTVVALSALVGCTSTTLNGSTSCNTFLGLKGNDRVTAIRHMLSDMHQSTSDGSVTVALGSASAMCSFEPGNKISDIYHG